MTQIQETMYMNIYTGSVDTYENWEPWISERGHHAKDFEGLFEVVKDANGDWIEA